MAIIFDINKAKNFSKIAKGRVFSGVIFSVLQYLSFVLIFGLVIIVIFRGDSNFIGLAKVVLGIVVLYPFFYNFLKYFYTPVADIASENIAEGLSEEMSRVIIDCVSMSRQNKFSTIEPIMLLAAYEKNIDGKYMLMRAGFGLEKDISQIIAQEISSIPKAEGEETFSEEFLQVMNAAKNNAISNNRYEITSGDILLGLIEQSDVFQRIMFDAKIDENDIKTIVEWHEYLKRRTAKFNLPFWESDGIVGGIGKDWSFGYTPILSQFAHNLNDEVLYAGEVNVYGRDREIDEIERVLSKSGQNNVLLVGEHGIGKKTIVKGFVSRVIRGKTLPSLKYMQVFQVDTGALLSGGGDSGEIAMRIKRIFNETARAGNIILFFDNFHALVSKKEGVGQVDTSEVILPYLSGAVKVIGATSLDEYHKNVEASPGVAAVMNRVDVREPSVQDTIKIVEEMIPHIENRDGVFWPYQSLRESVLVAQRYIHNKPFPEKSIEIIDEVSVEVAKAGRKIVFINDVDNSVSRKLEVPVAQAEGEEAKKLLNLESFLHERVIGQDQAIKAVASAMRRSRAGVQSKQRPIGSFLFLGPTGVGKTETSKALAEAYFGSEKNMIRVDMSEYQEQSSIYRLIGSPPSAGAEGEKGQLTTAIMDNPFSLVLLDEIEKAHKDILTLFLQVFDDGRLTDGTGRVIDFTNTIIIATSNAGSELIREKVQANVDAETLKKELLEFLQKNSTFRPEFLNRFDEVVAFHPLSQDQIEQVAILMLKSLSKRMAEKEITVEFKSEAVKKLAIAGFDPVYGARPMRRAIQDKVENLLADKLLSGELQRGARVTITENDI